MRLENKVAIITGASSGIGEGVAKRFLLEGAKVVGCGIEADMSIRDANATYVQANLSNPQDAEKVVQTAVSAFGKVDIVVNCAGITQIGSMETMSLETFKHEFTVNVDCVYNTCKAALPELKKQKGAAILNIASDLGVHPIPERIGYCPTKAAVIMLTKCIAIEQAPHIRCNSIMPGLVETPMIRDRIVNAEDPEAVRAGMAGMYPLNRMGTLDDMASAIVYLCSEEAGFVTGENLGVCGGSLI